MNDTTQKMDVYTVHSAAAEIIDQMSDESKDDFLADPGSWREGLGMQDWPWDIFSLGELISEIQIQLQAEAIRVSRAETLYAIESADSLNNLRGWLNHAEWLRYTDNTGGSEEAAQEFALSLQELTTRLPKFGGEPVPGLGYCSWDEARVLWHECGEWIIEGRAAFAVGDDYPMVQYGGFGDD